MLFRSPVCRSAVLLREGVTLAFTCLLSTRLAPLAHAYVLFYIGLTGLPLVGPEVCPEQPAGFRPAFPTLSAGSYQLEDGY